MSRNLSFDSVNHVSINELLQITLEEPASNNYKWELDIPTSFITIKSSYEPTTSTLLHSWTVRPNKSGQFMLYCHYRKMCCGGTIAKTVAYQIIVH